MRGAILGNTPVKKKIAAHHRRSKQEKKTLYNENSTMSVIKMVNAWQNKGGKLPSIQKINQTPAESQMLLSSGSNSIQNNQSQKIFQQQQQVFDPNSPMKNMKYWNFLNNKKKASAISKIMSPQKKKSNQQKQETGVFNFLGKQGNLILQEVQNDKSGEPISLHSFLKEAIKQKQSNKSLQTNTSLQQKQIISPKLKQLLDKTDYDHLNSVLKKKDSIMDNDLLEEYIIKKTQNEQINNPGKKPKKFKELEQYIREKHMVDNPKDKNQPKQLKLLEKYVIQKSKEFQQQEIIKSKRSTETELKIFKFKEDQTRIKSESVQVQKNSPSMFNLNLNSKKKFDLSHSLENNKYNNDKSQSSINSSKNNHQYMQKLILTKPQPQNQQHQQINLTHQKNSLNNSANNKNIKQQLKKFNIFTLLRLKNRVRRWKKRAQKTIRNKKFKRAVQKLRNVLRMYQYICEVQQINQSKLTQFDSNYRRYGFLPLYPDDSISSFWHILLIFFLICTAFWVTFTVSFIDKNETYEKELVDIIDIVFDIFFLMDIFINFISAYYDEQNRLITNQQQIISHYLKGWFIIDLITIFPIYFTGLDTDYNKLLRLLRLPRIAKLQKLIKISKNQTEGVVVYILEYLNMHLGVRKVLNILSSMILMSHFAACIYYFIARLEGFSEETWVGQLGVQDDSLFSKYILALYWSFQTLAQVGYGDIPCRSVPEQLFAILWMCFAIAFSSFVIQSIGIFVLKSNIKLSLLENYMTSYQEMAQVFKIPEALSREVEDFFQVNYSQNQFWGTGFDEYLNDQPQQYIEEIVLIVYHELLQKIPFFRLELNFTSLILPGMLFMRTNRDVMLYRKNDPSEEVFFILKGSILLLDEDYQIVLKLKEGEYFGQEEILEGTRRRFFAISPNNHTLLLVSKHQDFFNKIENFPLILEEIGIVTQTRLQSIYNLLEKTRQQQQQQDNQNQSKFANYKGTYQSIYYINDNQKNSFVQNYTINSPYTEKPDGIEKLQQSFNLEFNRRDSLLEIQNKESEVINQYGHMVKEQFVQWGRQQPKYRLIKSSNYYETFLKSLGPKKKQQQSLLKNVVKSVANYSIQKKQSIDIGSNDQTADNTYKPNSNLFPYSPHNYSPKNYNYQNQTPDQSFQIISSQRQNQENNSLYSSNQSRQNFIDTVKQSPNTSGFFFTSKNNKEINSQPQSQIQTPRDSHRRKSSLKVNSQFSNQLQDNDILKLSVPIIQINQLQQTKKLSSVSFKEQSMDPNFLDNEIQSNYYNNASQMLEIKNTTKNSLQQNNSFSDLYNSQTKNQNQMVQSQNDNEKNEQIDEIQTKPKSKSFSQKNKNTPEKSILKNKVLRQQQRKQSIQQKKQNFLLNQVDDQIKEESDEDQQNFSPNQYLDSNRQLNEQDYIQETPKQSFFPQINVNTENQENKIIFKTQETSKNLQNKPVINFQNTNSLNESSKFSVKSKDDDLGLGVQMEQSNPYTLQIPIKSFMSKNQSSSSSGSSDQNSEQEEIQELDEEQKEDYQNDNENIKIQNQQIKIQKKGSQSDSDDKIQFESDSEIISEEEKQDEFYPQFKSKILNKNKIQQNPKPRISLSVLQNSINFKRLCQNISMQYNINQNKDESSEETDYYSDEDNSNSNPNNSSRNNNNKNSENAKSQRNSSISDMPMPRNCDQATNIQNNNNNFLKVKKRQSIKIDTYVDHKMLGDQLGEGEERILKLASIQGKYFRIKVQKIYKNFQEISKNVKEYKRLRKEVMNLKNQILNDMNEIQNGKKTKNYIISKKKSQEYADLEQLEQIQQKQRNSSILNINYLRSNSNKKSTMTKSNQY